MVVKIIQIFQLLNVKD